MAAPPHARPGERAASAGRPIVAGIAPFLRTLPARATVADLWAGVEALTVEGEGRDRLARKLGARLDQRAHGRFAAFVRQARQYYTAVAPLDPVAKPLIAYYFALNLTNDTRLPPQEGICQWPIVTDVDPPSKATRVRFLAAPNGEELPVRITEVEQLHCVWNDGLIVVQ